MMFALKTEKDFYGINNKYNIYEFINLINLNSNNKFIKLFIYLLLLIQNILRCSISPSMKYLYYLQ